MDSGWQCAVSTASLVFDLLARNGASTQLWMQHMVPRVFPRAWLPCGLGDDCVPRPFTCRLSRSGRALAADGRRGHPRFLTSVVVSRRIPQAPHEV